LKTVRRRGQARLPLDPQTPPKGNVDAMLAGSSPSARTKVKQSKHLMLTLVRRDAVSKKARRA
jgi:hypothetical protein